MAGGMHRKRGGSRARPERSWRRWVLVAAVVVVVVALAAARLATVSAPALHVVADLHTEVSFPGAPPKLLWPATGEAAAVVAGFADLGSSGSTSPVPIASLAKVMTAYVVLQDHPLSATSNGFAVTLTAADASDQTTRVGTDQSTLRVEPGEVLDERQLLEALLIPSANNIASVLARYDAGSQAAFVAKMNATAHDLGMTETTYTDPSGFLTTTVSDATDQLRLAQKAMAVPALAQIVAMPSATFPVAGRVANYNQLVGTRGFVGVKTGSDSAAGGCLMFATVQQVAGHPVTVFGVVLGQDRGQTSTLVLLAGAFTASEALVLSVLASLSVKTVVPAGTPVLEARNADGRKVDLVTSRPLTALGWGGADVTVELQVPAKIHRLKAHQQLGTITAVGLATSSTPVAAATSMPGLSIGWRFRHLL